MDKQHTNIKYSNILIKKNIDNYILLFDKKNNKFKSIPKTFFKDFTLKDNKVNDKIFYTNNSAIHFYLYENDEKNNKLFGSIGKSCRTLNKTTFVFLHGNDENSVKNQVINFMLGYYNFDMYKTDADKKLNKIYLYHPKRSFKKIIEDALYIASIQNEIRSLINMPANLLNSNVYSKYIKSNLSKKIKLKVYDEKILKKIGCNLILGVNNGSKYPAKLLILEYKNLDKKIDKKESELKSETKKSETKKGKNKSKPVALIGKGVMFDSGGLNIKGGDFSDMKTDMAGSAIVYGTLKLLEHFNIKGHFIGLLPIVENMVDANSTRPGDILTAYNGKTVEIIDTDAEGRLIMADALAFSKNFNPYLCIDIATLTGQAASIFGNKSAVVMGNNNKLIQDMINSGIKNNEKFWELPMWKEYVELTKSNIADYKNYTYGVSAGTIMAGAFLSNFIPENTNWLHLDIAGVDFLKSNTYNRFSGASSESLRSLFSFLCDLKV
jgi:leucyl aminopeptidase